MKTLIVLIVLFLAFPCYAQNSKLNEQCNQQLKAVYKEFKYVSQVEAYTQLLRTCRGTEEFSYWCDKALGQNYSSQLAASVKARANLISVCQGNGEVATQNQEPMNNNGNNQSDNGYKGAINRATGEYYPGVAGGIINPRTGQFYQDTGGGYVNISTGEFIPKQ